jgi:hypothetical protein
MALLAVPGSSAWLEAMDRVRILTALFEELEPCRQCATVYYGAGGVLAHSLATVQRADFLLSHLSRVFPGQARAIELELSKRSQGGIPWRSVLILAAFLHDISKPETARKEGGRLRFFGHDKLGARRGAALMKRLKFSREHIKAVSTVTLNHLRPGNLASGGAVTNRAAYRFFRDLGEHALDLLLVCWADHASYIPEKRLIKLLATARCASICENLKGVAATEKKTIHHLQTVTALLRRLFDSKTRPLPERVIDGHDVMKALKILPGPLVGKWLEKVRGAQAEGKIRTRAEALAYLAKAH